MTDPFAPPSFLQKIVAREHALQRVAALARPLVFTNGVFDVLHRGHVTYLAQARALGASLVVALNTDASTRRLGKPGQRPLNAQADRAQVIAALESASLVTFFDDDTPLQLITRHPGQGRRLRHGHPARKRCGPGLRRQGPKHPVRDGIFDQRAARQNTRAGQSLSRPARRSSAPHTPR